jgi:DNA-binding PadR family transcriptional regulator
MHMALFQILSILRPTPSDASSVLARLDELTEGKAPSLPAFYRHLRRGMEEGWIEVEGTEQPDEGPGRPAQRYRITGEGEVALTARARELRVFTGLALDGRSRGGA